MMNKKSWIKTDQPKRIPVPGDKIIEEHIGRVATGDDDYSVAHMQAPPGWSEPPQTPEFDELTIMIKGRMEVYLDGRREVLESGEVLLAPAGVNVQYANPFGESNEYWAVCRPAFSPERARRKSVDD